jgi:16S rRNA processing protein RimM
MTARKRKVMADPGSPPGEPEYLVVGFLRRAHGLQGEMLMDVVTDFPERLKPGTTIYVGERHEPRIIETSRGHARGILIRLQGVASPEMTAAFRNQAMYVLTADRPKLPDGQYYHHHCRDCRR